MGNCGFRVAPTRPAHREMVLRTLERVEGMSLDALLAGVGRDWPFESFAEFLDAIEARGTAINVGALVGHTPVRLHVLGDEASEREATAAEIAAMRVLVRDALRAGALGFATSKSPTHVGDAGRPVPSRASSLEEIETLAGVLGEVGYGVMQATIGPGFFLDELAGIARATRRPVTWTALLGGMLGPEGHRFVLERSASMQAEGITVIPQVSCRPLTVEFQLKAPFPLESMSLFRPVSQADHAGKRRIYADPEFRRALQERSEQAGPIAGRFADMQVSEHPPEPALAERRLGDVAAERGLHPTDLMLDLALASDLETRFRLAVLNTDPAITAELLAHPASMLGLSDAGAHASQLCDACAPTELLGTWVRERGVLSLESGIRRLTGSSPTSSA
jgi:N-acyl-D-aspartate/D-glutamate deacylase